MKAPHAITLRTRHREPEEAYGPVKRQVSLEALFHLEDMVEDLAPLPTTYDVFPVHPFYFSEFGYTDIWNGLYLYPLGYEVSARVMEKAVFDCLASGIDLSTVKIPDFIDKYALNKTISKRYKRIIFLPGGNLLHAIDFDAVYRLLFSDDFIMVKPHPVFSQSGLRVLGAKIGFDRIIDPMESGMAHLAHCEKAWGTANSEIGIRAALLNIPYGDVTNTKHYPTMTYAAIHRLFGEDVKRNHQIVLAALASGCSGLIMPWLSEEEIALRMTAFFDLAMTIRKQFKPMYPVHVAIQFSPRQKEMEKTRDKEG